MVDRATGAVVIACMLWVTMVVSTWLAGNQIANIGDRADRLERQAATAEARADKLARRVVVLTDGWVAQRVVLDRLSAACVASGECVEVSDG